MHKNRYLMGSCLVGAGLLLGSTLSSTPRQPATVDIVTGASPVKPVKRDTTKQKKRSKSSKPKTQKQKQITKSISV